MLSEIAGLRREGLEIRREKTMQPSDGKVHEIPIDRIRQDTAMVTRGFFVLAFYPVLGVLTLMLPIIRDLPHIDPEKIGNPMLWLAVALAVTFLIVSRKCGTRFTSACLWAMIGSLVLLLLGGGVWLLGLTPRDFSPETLRDFPVAGIALAALLAGLLAWWQFIVPIWAAIRLLGTRIQPGDIALPDVMAARAQRDDERAEVPAGSRFAAATRYVALAWALGLASAVVVLWLLANDDIMIALIALILEFAAFYAVTMLWRRSRKLAALDAQEVLKRDPRSPVIYLRSFVDDSELMQAEWDVVLKTDAGSSARADAGKEESALARAWRRYSIGWLSTSGRIEEGIAPEFKSIGPFVGIGAPNEPLPELGAARAYFTSETWQDAIVKWVDMARLIIKVAGPTKWIRWELDTIIDCGALSKLVILIPPGAPQARVGRWQNLMVELQSTPWGPALTSVDPMNLVALRFLADGKVSIVTGGKGRLIDYLLAVRLMLYQLQDAP